MNPHKSVSANYDSDNKSQIQTCREIACRKLKSSPGIQNRKTLNKIPHSARLGIFINFNFRHAISRQSEVQISVFLPDNRSRRDDMGAWQNTFCPSCWVLKKLQPKQKHVRTAQKFESSKNLNFYASSSVQKISQTVKLLATSVFDFKTKQLLIKL